MRYQTDEDREQEWLESGSAEAQAMAEAINAGMQDPTKCDYCQCDLDEHVSYQATVDEPHEYRNRLGELRNTCGVCGNCARTSDEPEEYYS